MQFGLFADRPFQFDSFEALLATMIDLVDDPLAAAVIFDESICGFERGRVEVELKDERLQGFTRWTAAGETAPHEVAVTVDSERFFEHYFSVF